MALRDASASKKQHKKLQTVEMFRTVSEIASAQILSHWSSWKSSPSQFSNIRCWICWAFCIIHPHVVQIHAAQYKYVYSHRRFLPLELKITVLSVTGACQPVQRARNWGRWKRSKRPPAKVATQLTTQELGLWPGFAWWGASGRLGSHGGGGGLHGNTRTTVQVPKKRVFRVGHLHNGN